MRHTAALPALLGMSLLALCHCSDSSLRTAATVLASPPLVDFGTVRVGRRKALDVTLTVSGPGQVKLMATSVAGTSVFTASPAPAAAVTSSAPGKVTVTFQPTAPGPVDAVLHIANNSLDTPDLVIQLHGQGAPVHHDCDGYTGSPSTNIIQVPTTASASTVTVTCPDSSVLIGCGFLCDGGMTSGGTEMLDEKTCRADCQNASTVSATAFCYQGDPTCVTRVELKDVQRGTIATCPDDHPQLLGCTSRCVNANTENNNSGSYPSDPKSCDATCDYPGDTVPQLVAYCGNFPKAYQQVTQGNVPSGTASACPDQTTLVGGLGVCVNARAGGFIASDSNKYAGYCKAVDLSEIAAFCLED